MKSKRHMASERKARPATVVILSVALLRSAFAEEKYPLTMTAEFTQGKSADSSPRRTFHSGGGDYDCTRGDEHNGPICHTTLEWAELDRIAGTPDVVLFTLEDGSRVGVQSVTVNKMADYIECSPSSSVIFCTLYVEMLEVTHVSPDRLGKYGQTVLLSTEEFMAASAAKHRQLFNDKNVMTVHFRYRLKGKVEKDGFQRIEIEPSICPPCKLVHLVNPRGDGYYLLAKR